MSEHTEQCDLFTWARWMEGQYPELEHLHAVPNGGLRNKKVASKMKREGQRAGVWDIALDVARGQYHGFKGEMKYGRNKLTDSQLAWGLFYEEQGYYTAVAWDWQDMGDMLIQYLELDNE